MSNLSWDLVVQANEPDRSAQDRPPLGIFWARAARPSWWLIGLATIIVVAGCTIGPFKYADWVVTLNRLAFVVVFLAGAISLSNRGYLRSALAFESVAVTLAVAFTVPGLSTMAASLNMPYQDAALLAADRTLGFDWRAIVEWTRDRPDLSVTLSYVYKSLLWQPLILFPLLARYNPERLRRVLGTSTVALLITIAAFTFVPAQTGYVYLGYTHADFPDMRTNTAWGVAHILNAIRAGERQLSLDGLVTFPSYHAAGAMLLAYGWLAIPALRWIFVPLNILMLFSCVPIGSHYVVDVLAGMALALVCYPAVSRYFATTDVGTMSWPSPPRTAPASTPDPDERSLPQVV